MHETGIIPSTWHQCLKYSHDGEEKYIAAESKPFTTEEAHFTDVIFYCEEKIPLEVAPTVAPESNGDKSDDSIKKNILSHTFVKELSKQLSEMDIKILKEDLVFPATNLSKVIETNPPFDMLENSKSSKRQKEGWFDHRAKRLFEKSGYRKDEPSKLGSLSVILFGAKVHKTDRNGITLPQPKHGLGYVADISCPVKIKMKKVASNPIMVQIIHYEDVKPEDVPALKEVQDERGRVSVFERLGETQSNTHELKHAQRSFVFSRLGLKVNEPKPKKK